MNPKLAFALSQYALLLVFSLSAWGYGRQLLRPSTPGAPADGVLRFGLQLAIGAGVWICALQLAGIAHLLTLPLVVAVGTGGLALATVAAFTDARRLRQAGGRRRVPLPHWSSVVVVAAAATFVLMPLSPPMRWDELAYHLPHARAWAEAGALTINDWVRYPWFPYNFDLLYSAALLVANDVFTHLLHAWAGWLVALLVHRWALRLAGYGAATIAPLLWLALAKAEFTSAYIDLGTTLFITAGFIALQLWREATREQPPLLWLGCFLLGIAAGTKYQALVFLPLAAGIVGWRDRRPVVWLRCLGILAIGCGYWYGRNALLTGDPFNPMGGRLFGFTDWNDLDYQRQVGDIKANFGWPDAWLLLALAAPMLLLIRPAAQAGMEIRHRTAWATIVFSAWGFGTWMVTSHYPRYLTPVYPALAVLTGAVAWQSMAALLERAQARWPWVAHAPARRMTAIAFLLAGLGTAITVFERDRHSYQGSVVAATPAEREAVLFLNLPKFAGAIQFLRTRPGARIYQANMEEMLYYLPHPVWGDQFGPWRYSAYMDLEPCALAARLRQEQFTLLAIANSDNHRLLNHSQRDRCFKTVYADKGSRVLEPLPAP